MYHRDNFRIRMRIMGEVEERESRTGRRRKERT